MTQQLQSTSNLIIILWINFSALGLIMIGSLNMSSPAVSFCTIDYYKLNFSLTSFERFEAEKLKFQKHLVQT